MPTILLVLTFLTLLVLVLLTVYRLVQERSAPSGLQTLINQQDQQLKETVKLVLEQLGRNQEAQDRSSTMMHTRIDHATRVVSDVQGKLLQLEEANKRIFDLGKDISNLQKILQAPKLRGGMGEIWLGDLIGQIIPSDRYKMQYTFKSGEICDAVIFLRDGLLLPIDAKFSLENFVRMLEAPEETKMAFKKQFTSDMKKRIDEISKKYVLPHENTLEFAFMYVPAENVYYQAFIQEEDTLQLLSYAFAKKVIPVSPSSFYAYLQVILFGLRGLEIEKSAKDIQKNLAGLASDFGKFHETYEKVGTHLRHAQQSLETTDKKLDQLENRFTQITQQEATLIAEPEATSHE